MSSHPGRYQKRPQDRPTSDFAKVVRFLLLGWEHAPIERLTGVPTGTIERWHRNLRRYGTPLPPHRQAIGRPKRLTKADEDALLAHLLAAGWKYQDEMIAWLAHERDVEVSQSTISRVIKRRRWSRKEIRRISLTQSASLRALYLQDISRYPAEDLIFIDETLFNERTCWRSKGYSPIGTAARYSANVLRGKTWSILAAMSLDGWLPATSMLEGYWKNSDFVEWITGKLIPNLDQTYGRPMVIVMDNCSTHVAENVREAIESQGHILKYLPPYSPDFNPIELSFSVLKGCVIKLPLC
jgi:transposase